MCMEIIQGKPLVSRFRVKAALGGGPSGQLILASDSKLNNKDVVIRSISRAGLESGHDLEELRQQVFRNIRLENPNIVRTLEFIDSPELLGYLLEYLPGDNLEQFADACGLSLTQRLWIALSVSKTVLSLHESGISHGALEAENIIFRKGSFKLCEPLVLVRSQPQPLTEVIRHEVAQVAALIERLVSPLYQGPNRAHLKRFKKIIGQVQSPGKINSLAALNVALEGLIARILDTPRRQGSYLVLGIAMMLVALMYTFSTPIFSKFAVRIASQLL